MGGCVMCVCFAFAVVLDVNKDSRPGHATGAGFAFKFAHYSRDLGLLPGTVFMYGRSIAEAVQ